MVTLGVTGVVFLVAFEAFAVVTALPAALGQLHGVQFYGLAFGGYLAASLFACVVAGGVCDRTGPAPPFRGGVMLFALGSLLVGAAPDIAVFMLGRAVQGLGAGLMIVVFYVIVVRVYAEDVRPKAFAAMASAWVVPSIAGPPLAGFVTEHAGWRWIFFGIPVLLLPAAIALLPHVRSDDEDRRAGASRSAGLVWLAAGTATGSVLAQYAMQSRVLVVVAGCGIGAAILLVLSLPRLLPSGTLRARTGVPALVLLRGLLAGAFFGTEVLLPLMLITQRGMSPSIGGLILAAGSAGWAVGSWVQGHQARRCASQTLVASSGVLLSVGILFVMTGLSDRVPPVAAGLGWLLAGTGMGAGLTTVNRGALEGANQSRHGMTSSALQVSDALASTITTGACATVVTGGGHGIIGPARFSIALILMAMLALVAAWIGLTRTQAGPGPLDNGSSDAVA